MRAVKLVAPREMRLVEVDRPSFGPRDVLVRVESVGVCGSDLHYYEEGRIGSNRLTQPLILGHEYAGVVEAVGNEADARLIGKRVAVEPGTPCLECEWCKKGDYNVCPDMAFPGTPPYDGALCEYTAVRAESCFPVPETMKAPEAAALEPFAVALHTIELARVKPGETAAILGLGPVGLLTAMLARFSGVDVIYATDLHDYRVEAGRRHGVDHAFNAARQDTVETILRETGGRGVDVVFDVARSTETLGFACRIARPAGRCVLTGISGEEEDPLPVGVARRKGLTLRWCRRFKHNYPKAISLAASGKIDVNSIITHSFPLEKTQEAFELVSRAQDNVLKAIINP